MDITIFPSPLFGSVRAVASKSQAHRALICSALSEKPTLVVCESESDDIAATIACLSALGGKIVREPNGYTVTPIERKVGESLSLPRGELGNIGPPSLLCGESGSTLRFLLPTVCALGRSVSFLPRGRLPERPLSPLYEELIHHGCALSPQGAVPFNAAGQLTPGYYSLDAGVSSQFVSGLLFALPLLDGDSELYLTGQMESYPYIEMTMAMLEMFHIQIGFNKTTFTIPGRQTYRSPGTLSVEGDWSNAAFWLGAGALCENRVTCDNLDLHSCQGDRAIIDLLARFGAHIETAGSSVTVSGGKLKGINIDARDIPDLVPVLAVIGSAAEGTTTISNAGRLRTKESDRLTAISDVLQTIGVDIKETEDGLIITGGDTLKVGKVSSHNDHRIAMAAAIAATICKDQVTIKNAEAVNKSYPNFFEDLKSLGGKVELGIRN